MTIEIDRIRSIGIGRVAIAGWEGDTIEGGRPTEGGKDK
jgi:hypothetical protein